MVDYIENVIRKFARLFISFDSHIYELYVIVVLGSAANIMISGAGRDYEYDLVINGSLLILSAGSTILLRRKRVIIEKNADSERNRNMKAFIDKIRLEIAEETVDPEIEKNALLAHETQKESIRRIIDDSFAHSKSFFIVALISAISLVTAGFGLNGVYKSLFSPANISIKDMMDSANNKYYELTKKEIALLNNEVDALSVEIDVKGERIYESMNYGLKKINNELKYIRLKYENLSKLVEELKDSDKKINPNEVKDIKKDNTKNNSEGLQNG